MPNGHEGMTDDVKPGLRERLIAAKLAGHKNERAGWPYCFRSNESAAEVALAIFAAELRELADTIDRGVTFPIPPSVISALVRERADFLDPKGDDQ